MAVDPATLKALAKVAAKVVTDEEARKKLLIVIIAPTVGIVLLFSMILHILTMPFGFLAEAFLGTELSFVEEMRADSDFTQLTGVADREESDGQNYEGILLSYGSREVVYYNQMDERWGKKLYGTSSSIGEGGCGPTAMAIVISTFTGENHDPLELSNWSVKNGHRCEGNGSYHTLIPAAAKAYGLKVEGVGTDMKKVATALAEGKLVVALMSKGHFTTSGHFIVLRGITENNKILVADPASRKRSDMEWDIDIFPREARKGAGAGGAFWIIYP